MVGLSDAHAEKWRPLLDQIASAKLGAEDAVDALCMKTAEHTWLFLANFDPDSPTRITLDGLGNKRLDDTKSVLLAGDTPFGQLATVESKFTAPSIDLPPLSIARIAFS